MIAVVEVHEGFFLLGGGAEAVQPGGPGVADDRNVVGEFLEFGLVGVDKLGPALRRSQLELDLLLAHIELVDQFRHERAERGKPFGPFGFFEFCFELFGAGAKQGDAAQHRDELFGGVLAGDVDDCVMRVGGGGFHRGGEPGQSLLPAQKSLVDGVRFRQQRINIAVA